MSQQCTYFFLRDRVSYNLDTRENPGVYVQKGLREYSRE